MTFESMIFRTSISAGYVSIRSRFEGRLKKDIELQKSRIQKKHDPHIWG